MSTSIHIIEIECALEAQALRAAAECWGAQVSVTWVANSAQIVEFLSGSPPHDLILICAHGDRRGVLLPLVADEVKARFPFHDALGPKDLAGFVRLKRSVVLCSACATGTDAMARAFLMNGARSFIAPPDFPDGDVALWFALNFIFAFLKDGDVTAAFDAANRLQGDNRFSVFETTYELAEP